MTRFKKGEWGSKGEEHRCAKLTEQKVREIYAKKTSRRGEQRRIAAEYGISRHMVGAIWNKKAWRHIHG